MTGSGPAGRIGCVDVGGTDIKAGLLDGTTLLATRREPTPRDAPDVAAPER